MKKATFLIIISLFFIHIIPAQTFLSVEVTDPVYRLLDMAVQKKLMPQPNSAKPYTKAQVISYLEEIASHGDQLSETEQEVIAFYLDHYNNNYQGMKSGKARSEGSMGSFEAGVKLEGESRVNFNMLENWYTYNAIMFYMQGDISDYLSYYGMFGGTIDKVAPDYFYKHITMEVGRSGSPYYIEDGEVQTFEGENWDYTAPGSFAPYSFTAQWDGHHSDPLTGGHNDGVISNPSIAMKTADEITFQAFDDDLILRWGKYRREWGYGDGSLGLSGTAYPFEGFEAHLEPVDWFTYSWVVGSLGNWFVDSYLDSEYDPEDAADDELKMMDQFTAQKNFSMQQFEIRPFSWLSLNAASSAIWGKRFELAYMSPLMMPFIIQEQNGDMDNVALMGSFQALLPWGGKTYFSVFLDETSIGGWDEFFTYARNMYAYQGGIKTRIPGLPFASLTLQYTKIEPFTYSHYYETDYASSSFPVDMTYTNAGENLGYHLPPNSDEIMVKFECFPTPGLSTYLTYQLIRHGTNDTTTDSNNNDIPDGQIYGDIYIPFDYGVHSYYPDKDFLKDGVYDWSNIVSVGGYYSFKNFPAKIGIGYIFSYTFWDTNGYDVSTIGSFTQNIISISYTIFK